MLTRKAKERGPPFRRQRFGEHCGCNFCDRTKVQLKVESIRKANIKTESTPELHRLTRISWQVIGLIGR